MEQNKKGRHIVRVSPIFSLIEKKQKVGAEYAAEIELLVLLHFDAAKRGKCPHAGHEFLTMHLIIASYLASRLNSQRFHDQVTRAYAALGRAAMRPSVLLDLTTTEYHAMREALRTYFRSLPNIEQGMMDEAAIVAFEKMYEPSSIKGVAA